MDIQEKWIEFKRTGDIRLRNELIENYYKLVSYIASKIHRGLPAHVSKDDLISHGTIGLMDAVEKFDPNKGVKFETYATTRIQGSILDELRASDWVPRSVRSKQKQIEKQRLELEGLMGQSPSVSEIADGLGWENSEVSKTLYSSYPIMSINQNINSDEGAQSYAEQITTGDDGNSDLLFLLSHGMSLGIAGLEDKERAVVTLYYYENLTLQQIGVILGVTESRVCQIHSKALVLMAEDLEYI
jgi:RNA polymerase sigma factor for flagellar operon FliA